jgi:hypothetical protein
MRHIEDRQMSKPDALLTSTRSLITIMKVLLILSYAGLCFGVIVGVLGHGIVVAKVAAVGAPPIAAWGVTLLLALIAAMLIMAERILRRLAEIVDSVGEGDPFVPVNARRIEQMGYLTLAMNFAAIPLGMLAGWLAAFGSGVAPQAGPMFGGLLFAKSGFGFSMFGLILKLVLFILARVFRQGAEMRDELEGTV